MKHPITYCNGSFVQLNEAGISLTDLGLQRGYAIFDFLRVVGSTPLFLEDHLDRFYHSAALMHLTVKESREELRLLIHQMIHANNFEHAGIRILLAGGSSSDGYTITIPTLALIQQPLAAPPETFPMEGIALCSYSFQRQLSTVKTTDYLMAIWLQPWLKEQGGQDILYHQEGYVTECPRSNIFIVTEEGILVTPTFNMLKGVTRKNILSIALEKGIPTEERNFHLEEVHQAREVFITSSTKRILPVNKLDGKDLNSLDANYPVAKILWDELLKKE